MADGEVKSNFKKSVSVSDTTGMPQNPEIINSLRNIGLNQYEARAYHALTSFGSSTAGELSEVADLPRPRVYDVLRGLQDKGFVVLKPGRPVKYASLPLIEALKTLRKQRENDLASDLTRIEGVGKSLFLKLKPSQAGKGEVDELVWTLKGKQAIYSKLAAMISGAKENVVISSTPEGVMSKIKAAAKELDSAKARGVKIHVVSPISASEVSKLATVHNREVPTRFVVADNEALIFLTRDKTHPDEEVGMWLQSEHIADTLRHFISEKK